MQEQQQRPPHGEHGQHQASTAQRKRRRRKPKRRIRWGRLLILLLVLFSLLGLISWGAYQGYQWIQHRTQETAEATEAPPGGVVAPPPDTIPKHPLKEFVPTNPGKPMYLMVAAVEEGHPDVLAAIYVVSINREEGQIDVIGIPGNSKITGRDQKSVMALRDMYASKGLQVTHAAVEDIFHIEIPFFVVYKQGAFEKAMKEFGSVSLYVEGNFQRYDESGKDISLVQGYQVLDPQKAWSYITYADAQESGLEQVQRQERFFQAFGQQFHNSSWPWRMWDTYQFWDQVETNISTWDAVNFARYVGEVPLDHITYYILPGTPEVDAAHHITYWDINPAEAQQLLGITMNPDGGTNDK